MLVQAIAGSLHYSKNMRVGTYVLAVAAIQLIDVGPRDPIEALRAFRFEWRHRNCRLEWSKGQWTKMPFKSY